MYHRSFPSTADAVEIDHVVPTRQRRPRFIKGPIPLTWMERAARCSPAAVKIGLLLFHHHGMGKDQITISNEQARRMHVSRNTKTAALNALEEAGLVKLKRVGQRVIICLCEYDIADLPCSKAVSVQPSPTHEKQPNLTIIP